MSITRKFLDWTDPPLLQAVRYLLARYAPPLEHQRVAEAGDSVLRELRAAADGSGSTSIATASVAEAVSESLASPAGRTVPPPHFSLPSDRVAPGVWDLDQVVLVVPGGRAGRELLEHLVAMAERLELTLYPPRIETVGRLPELLYEAKRPAASELIQQLAWVRALKKMDRGRLQRVVPQLPGESDTLRWLTLARLLSRTHRELAADGMDFEHLARLDWKAGERQERDRWRVLQSLQHAYLRTLDRLDVWDLQTARLVALEHRECRTDRDILLVGTTDMNSTMRRMLDQVADRVTALVFAPEERAEDFDEHGCVAPEAWESARCELRPEQIRVVDGPIEQAEAAVAALASRDGRYRADQVTIGVPDERLVPHLQRHLERAGVRGRWAVGRNLPETAPYRLLQAVAQYLERGRFADFAQLVRHPDVSAQIDRRLQEEGRATGDAGSWLAAIDRYYADHLPPQLPAPGASRESGTGDEAAASGWLGSASRYELVSRVHGLVEQWLGPLRTAADFYPQRALPLSELRMPGQDDPPSDPAEGAADGGERVDAKTPGPELPQRKLDRWCDPMVRVLAAVYEGVELDRDRRSDHFTLTAAQRIREQLIEQMQVPSLLSPRVSAADAIRLVLEQTASATAPDLPDDQAISMLGWLELPLDSAPMLVLTSFNEGFVPSSVNADLFLPNNLRQRLGLLDNQRRYARDAYAFQAVTASRRELEVIVARRDGEGNPLSPSRLLFATDHHTVAERARWFFDPEGVRPPQADASSAEPPTPALPPASTPDSAPASTPDSTPDSTPPARAAEPAVSPNGRSQFSVPRPVPQVEPLKRLSVTAFRTYLACPYRFYLRHVLKLERVTDEAEELDAAAFGNLIHDVLNGFGLSDVRDSSNEDEIEAFLLEELGRQVASRLGTLHLAPVNVQLMQLRSRLRAFAGWQAQWRREGWQIRYSEQAGGAAGDEPVWLNVEPGVGLQLTGRIDRIDQNERTGQWLILDYKTSDTPRKPEQVHRKNDQWVDLQLPLYRHLARRLVTGDEPRLGYVQLPKDTSKVGLAEATWSPGELTDADELALEVVRNVLEQRFWPPALSPSGFFDDLAAICQDSVFDRENWWEAVADSVSREEGP